MYYRIAIGCSKNPSHSDRDQVVEFNKKTNAHSYNQIYAYKETDFERSEL